MSIDYAAAAGVLKRLDHRNFILSITPSD